MEAPLDVFAILGDGNSIWIGCTQTVNEAVELMRKCKKTKAKQFFIHSQKTGHKTFYRALQESEVIRLELQP